MKTRPTLLRSIGVLMALLVFAALPNSVLATPCETCCAPACELYYGGGNNLYLELETSYPSDATIFFTKTINTPNTTDPTHTGTSPGPGTYSCANGCLVPIPYNSTIYIRALAWRSDRGDSPITACDQHNPND